MTGQNVNLGVKTIKTKIHFLRICNEMPARQKHVSGHVIRKGGCPEIPLRTIKTGLSNKNILLDITNLAFL